MIKFINSTLLITATLLTSIANAQAPLVVGGQSGPVLRAGTEVSVRTRMELTTKGKALRAGQRFDVETTDPITLAGRVIIPAGTPGTGEITSVRNKGMWGKSGHFDARLLYLRLNDRQIRISGSTTDKGKAGGVGAVAVSAVVFLPAGFFMTGTSARLPAGTVIRGSLDEDIPLAFADEPKTSSAMSVAAPIRSEPAAPAIAPVTVISATAPK